MNNTSPAPARVGDGDPKSHGRWRLNAGSEMTMEIPGVHAKSPIRVVVDLSTAKFANTRIPALYNHNPDVLIGYWERGSIAALGIDADLMLIDTSTDANRELFPEAARIAAQAKAGVPLEVSIGANPDEGGDWEAVEASDTITMNGQEYKGEGDFPLFVLRNARIYEASIVTFGADSKTGRVAASTQKPPVMKESTVSEKATLKSLLARHNGHGELVAGLFADGKTDAEIATAVVAADMEAKDEEIKALKAENAILKETNEKMASDMECADDEEDEEYEEKDGKDAKAKVKAARTRELDETIGSMQKQLDLLKAARGSSRTVKGTRDGDENGQQIEAPKTLTAAMNQMYTESGGKLKGAELRAAALAKYPKIERV